MARIIIIDDDLAMDILRDSLDFRGHEARRIADASTALKDIESIASSDLVMLDIIMPWPEGRAPTGPTGACAAGMEILRELRKRKSDLPVVVYSATQDAAVIDAIADDPSTIFFSKWDSHPVREIMHEVNRALGNAEEPADLQPFIVHGHNDAAKLRLKNYLQNTLHLPEPTILHEQPDWGRTLIEKFEEYAAASALVFVLLTPDDVGADAADENDLKRRARQNVIFEMGYFLGMLGRRSGRVLLLYHPPLELPTDLSGVVYIDIAQGIEQAGERIRREVDDVRTRE